MSIPDDPAPHDAPRLLRRREALLMGGLGVGALAGGAGALFRAAAAIDGTATQAAACVLTPEQTEGPFHIDNALYRRDIRGGRPGTPLYLRLTIVRAAGCAPIRNADVELWHADADGTYSGVGSAAPSSRFLRGHQRSDAAGLVRFLTIYPGWYPGRTPHIHVKVHVGGDEVHTGQIYLPERVTDAVYRRARYAGRGPRDTTNASDGIYGDGGARSVLRVQRLSRNRGYVGRLTMGVTT